MSSDLVCRVCQNPAHDEADCPLRCYCGRPRLHTHTSCPSALAIVQTNEDMDMDVVKYVMSDDESAPTTPRNQIRTDFPNDVPTCGICRGVHETKDCAK